MMLQEPNREPRSTPVPQLPPAKKEEPLDISRAVPVPFPQERNELLRAQAGQPAAARILDQMREIIDRGLANGRNAIEEASRSLGDVTPSVRTAAARVLGTIGAKLLSDEQRATGDEFAQCREARRSILHSLSTRLANERDDAVRSAMQGAARAMASERERGAMRLANPALAEQLFGPERRD